MKKYLMFAMAAHYPYGGWNDLVGSFDTLEEVQTKWAQFHEKKEYYHAHVVDITIGKIVGKFYQFEGVQMLDGDYE